MSHKLSIELCQEVALQKGGTCLSSEYTSSKTKLQWKCSEGHKWDMTIGKVRQGQWCPRCSRSRIRGQSIEVAGKVFPSIAAAAEAYSLDRGCVEYRLKNGWSNDEAFGVSQKPSARTGKKYFVNGLSFDSIVAAAKHFQIDSSLVRNRLRNSWLLEEALGIHPHSKTNPSRGKKVIVNGTIYPSLAAAALYFGIEPSKARSRIRKDWSAEQAFGIAPPRRKRECTQYEEIDGKIFPRANMGEYKLYLVTNIVNGKEYVGITLGTLEKRWGEHLSMGPGATDTKLKRAIRKHGIEHFKIELLRSDAKTYRELMEQEKAEIAHRGTYENSYNSTCGGELVFNARSITIGEMTFPTLSSTAEYFRIDESLIRARIDAMGWSIEEAVGLKRRPKTKYASRGEIIVSGQTFESHKAAAAHFGVNFQKYSLRLNRYDWTPEQALGLQPPPKGPSGIRVEVRVGNEVFSSITAAAKRYGVNASVVAHRIQIGWNVEQALGPKKPPRKIRVDYRFTVGGMDFPSQKAAALHFGVDYKRYNALINRNGWTPAQALGLEPPPPSDKKTISIDGLTFDSLASAAKHFSISRQVVYDRLKLGWDIEKALKTQHRKHHK